ncbi:MAG TPA: hypothetical protein VFM38_06005, partial [Candidatus Limnocylindrales bacterium]|nr:hypothetical protein [Candidatus Limnocylindrales bacterium]
PGRGRRLVRRRFRRLPEVALAPIFLEGHQAVSVPQATLSREGRPAGIASDVLDRHAGRLGAPDRGRIRVMWAGAER